MKKIIASLLLIVMIFGLVACAGSTPASETTATPSASAAATASPAVEGVLNLQWYQASGIDTLFENPWLDCQSLYPYMIFEALLSQNSDGTTYEAKLATDWKVSDDGLTYTFTIRDGVTWSDGKPFTVDDVVFTLNSIAAYGKAGTYVASHLKNIAGYADVAGGTATTLSGVASTGNTLTITLANPDRNFLYGMASCYILPQHLLGTVKATEIDAYAAYWSCPIGTGPYVIDKVSFPDYFTAKANTTYWGNQPGIKNVLFTSYDTGKTDAVVASLVSGDLDYAYGNALNDIEVADNVVSQNPNMTSELQTSYYTRFFCFNLGQREDGNTKADLQNEKVRQAFNLILDKEAIASCYNGQATALSTMVNPASDWYNTDLPAFKRDVATAKTMLQDAGFDFSQTIDIAYYYSDQTTADIMALITQNFAEAGVTVKTTLLSGDLTTLIYTSSNFDMLYAAYAGANSPIEMYQLMTSTTSLKYMGAADARGPMFDDLYHSYAASIKVDAAKEYGNKLQAAGLEGCFILPVYSLNTIVIHNTAKVSIPDTIFDFDNTYARNWKFDEWSLIG